MGRKSQLTSGMNASCWGRPPGLSFFSKDQPHFSFFLSFFIFLASLFRPAFSPCQDSGKQVIWASHPIALFAKRDESLLILRTLWWSTSTNTIWFDWGKEQLPRRRGWVLSTELWTRKLWIIRPKTFIHPISVSTMDSTLAKIHPQEYPIPDLCS